MKKVYQLLLVLGVALGAALYASDVPVNHSTQTEFVASIDVQDAIVAKSEVSASPVELTSISSIRKESAKRNLKIWNDIEPRVFSYSRPHFISNSSAYLNREKNLASESYQLRWHRMQVIQESSRRFAVRTT